MPVLTHFSRTVIGSPQFRQPAAMDTEAMPLISGAGKAPNTVKLMFRDRQCGQSEMIIDMINSVARNRLREAEALIADSRRLTSVSARLPTLHTYHEGASPSCYMQSHIRYRVPFNQRWSFGGLLTGCSLAVEGAATHAAD